MSTVECVRFIYPDGEVSVRYFSFSQVCEMASALSEDQRRIFYRGETSVITERDSYYAEAGTSLKYVGKVSLSGVRPTNRR